MKKTLINKLSTLLGIVAVLGFSSCLKDKNFVDFAAVGTTVEIPLGGKSGVGALTESADTLHRTFAVNIASPKPLSSDLTVTLGVDQATVDAFNASQSLVTYGLFPADAYSIDKTSIVIPAGTRTQLVNVTIYKSKLDPSKSYLLPIAIKDAQGQTISGNFGIKYYSVIGNDFAGVYTWEYRRYQNGTGPGTVGTPPRPAIPSAGEGSVVDGGGSFSGATAHTTVVTPVTATEFKMETGYNTTHVFYHVSFTRTVGAGGLVTYTNWKVFFPADELQKWADAGISNFVPPVFTLPPPATSAAPKFFELNYVSGGAAGRYIDDTYKK
jgi:hypothetical protein